MPRKLRGSAAPALRLPDGASHCFVTPNWIRCVCLLAAVLVPVAAWQLHRSEGWTFLTIASVPTAVVAVLGLLDALSARVVIYAERMVVVRNLLRRTYARGDFVDVTWAKGCPVSLGLANGTRLKLPPVGGSTQGMANSLRAWIRRKREGIDLRQTAQKQ